MAKSDFYNRFGIEIDAGEARRRFINRVCNKLSTLAKHNSELLEKLAWSIPNLLGERHDDGGRLDPVAYIRGHINGDFYRVLQVVERLWELDPRHSWDDQLVNEIIEVSEAPLGIRWELGKFYPQGDELLDMKLVKDPLDYLKRRGHLRVADPFEKALRHLLAGDKNPSNLADAVTDAYEALEAMAKVVTGRHENDLSSNAELFVSKLGVSLEYGKLLRLYIEYANRFRHAPSDKKPRPSIQYKEAESFVYMTGLFLRLAFPEGSL